MASALIPHIYHERQEAGSMLCAQHALNALLQGDLFDPSQLSDIAKRLDQLEQSQLDEATWQSRDRDSLNMDDTGYFSVSVLEGALEAWGLRLLRWRSEVMRPFQDKPEQQLAFVLNLENHWFTIRSFSGGFWFNLNSFLKEPTWIGLSYLGALLQSAESEGYSVFVVAQADDSRSDFHTSIADECGATLPPGAAVEGGADAVDNLSSAAQGLKPSLSAGAGSSSSSLPRIGNVGLQDEDAELQAAIRASLAESDAHMALKASTASGGSNSSRMHSPTVAGQRRSRGGVPLGDQEVTMADQEDEETDAQVDAIAPSRRRARGLLLPGAPSMPNASTSFAARGSAFVLPTASGGRRRVSRQQSEEGEQASFVRVRGQHQARRQDGSSAGGSSHGEAINVTDDDDLDDRSNDSSIQHRSTANLTAVGRASAPIVVDDTNEEDDDDFVQLQALASAPRSPFLNPALVRSGGSTNSDDDFHSISSAEGEANLGESWVQGDIDAVRRQAAMQDQREYDDEDAQLQAALEASMRDAGAAIDLDDTFDGINQLSAAPRGFAAELANADWVSEENMNAIREAQASFTAPPPAARSNTPPPPADVERIARMRAEAKKRALDEEEARLRGTTLEEEEAAAAAAAKKEADAVDEDDEEDSSDDDEPELTPEQIRQARLARFGAT